MIKIHIINLELKSMKSFIFAVAFLSLSTSAFSNNNDGGWSSSGGGEYIITQNNPWFIGEEEVKWCIDHGGTDKFSLNFKQSKIEIEYAILNLTTQLRSINQRTDYMSKPDGSTGQIFRKNDNYELSDKFIYTQNCEEADLEFILGNYNNSKIQTLISNIGLEKFKKIAGITIRTNYLPSLRSKGFIYIAADKGDIQYSGSRNTIFQSKTIWDSYEKIGSDALFPSKFIEGKTYEAFYKNKKIKDYTSGLLAPVALHEFGHILGFGHNHNENIMDEDYPAKVIQQGIVFKNEFLMKSNILSGGLLETHLDRRIGFEWNYIYSKYNRGDIDANSSAISDFLFNLSVDTNPFERKELFFIFDWNDGVDEEYNPNNEKNQLQLAIYDENFNYKIIKKFDFISDLCQNPRIVETINLRQEQEQSGSLAWIFDADLQKWIETNPTPYQSPETTRLLRFDDNFYCCKILTGTKFLKKQYLNLKVKHGYFGDHEMTITDDNGYSVRLNFSQTTISNNPNEQLPKPSLNLEW